MAVSLDLAGQVAVVTGASRGIGRGVALALAQAGATVAATARSAADLESLEAEVAVTEGGRLVPVPADLADVDSIRAAFERIGRELGRVDILVGNAGLGFNHDALEVTEDDWDGMMAVNLKGLFFASQAAARLMAARRYGRIVHMSSQAGLVGIRRHAVYSASKGGVNMLTKVLALEWAEHGINVNAIAPTFVYTPGTAPLLDGPGLRDEILARIPLRQLGTPADVAGAVVYLATAASRLVTGTVLMVDGGWTAQ
jgi:NAD(P)-dependent dehydrogenase (short-subunit alcohol dehydrogenase family)